MLWLSDRFVSFFSVPPLKFESTVPSSSTGDEPVTCRFESTVESWSSLSTGGDESVTSPSDGFAGVSSIAQGGTNVLAIDPSDTQRLTSAENFTLDLQPTSGKEVVSGCGSDGFLTRPVAGSNIVVRSKTIVTGPVCFFIMSRTDSDLMSVTFLPSKEDIVIPGDKENLDARLPHTTEFNFTLLPVSVGPYRIP